MSYKGKGMKVAKLVLATTVAISVIAVTNQTEAASQKEAVKVEKHDGYATKYISTVNKEKEKDKKDEKDSSESKKTFTLSLMHTNDTHAHLDNVAKKGNSSERSTSCKTTSIANRCGRCILWYFVFQ